MLNTLLNSANGPLQELLARKGMGPESAVAVKETFLEVIQKQVSSGNFDGVREMFSGKETDPESSTVQYLKSDLTSGLVEKLGIDQQKALSLASVALPFLLNLFNKKVNDAPQSNEEIAGSVVDSIKEGPGSGLGSVLSSVFGAENDPNSIDLGDVIDFGAGLFKKK